MVVCMYVCTYACMYLHLNRFHKCSHIVTTAVKLDVYFIMLIIYSMQELGQLESQCPQTQK